MKEESHNPVSDREIEARIVALLLGEASDFERDELHRLIEQRPELAMLKDRLQSVHELLEEVSSGESPSADQDWQLAADKRSAVLAVIDGEGDEQSANEAPHKPSDERSVEERDSLLWSLTRIAALVCFVVVPGSLVVLTFWNHGTVRTLSQASSDAYKSNAGSEHHWQEPSSPFVASSQGGDRADGFRTNQPAKVLGAEPENALSSIRDSLGDMAEMPTEGEGRSVTIGLDPQGAPTADLDLSFSGGSFGTPPSAKQFESATASTESDRSPGPQTFAPSDNAANGADQDGNWSYQWRTASQPRARSSLDGTLSFPKLAEPASGEFSTDQSGPVRSTIVEFLPSTTNRELSFSQTNKWQDGTRRSGLTSGLEDQIELESKSLAVDERHDTSGGGNFGGMGGGLSGGGDYGDFKTPEEETESSRSITRDFYESQPSQATVVDSVDRPEQPDATGFFNYLHSSTPAKPSGVASGQVQGNVGDATRLFKKDTQPARSALSGENGWYHYTPPTDESRTSSIKKTPLKRASAPAGLHEKTARSEPYSTFSLHVSDVSFKLARAALAQGEWPDAARIRIEEFVNALDYGDPMPSHGEKVACRLEQSIHPFLQQRNLLRVSMRTAAAGRSSSTPLRLTLLLDNSGSMERIDRQQTVRRAFALLAQQLKPIDQVTLISFARQPRLLADKVGGAQSDQLVRLIDNLPSEGGTNIEAALRLAFEKATEQQFGGAQNRIILLTDGAVNLGDANPDSLSRMITTMRNAGIAFDAAGISAEGLNDEILEALTRQGDGRYYLLDSLEAADDGFARQIAGALRPSAKNVKVQIEFNPKRVGRYKLLGFEKHRLKQEEFRNDAVDAAEMAAAEAGVALYQFEAKPDGEGDVGSVSVRFLDLSTGQMIENCWPIPYEADAPRPDQAAPSLRLATSAALLAAKLRGEPLGESVDLKTLSELMAELPEPDRSSSRVQQLQLMIQQARQMSGE